MIVPDANILIYAYDERSAFFEVARDWLERSLAGSVDIGLSWQTITAFVRITTDKRAFPSPYSATEAFEIVENWVSAPAARIVLPTANHLQIFSSIAVETKVAGAMVMDAHLAALTIEHGATLATTDRDFRKFDGLRVVNPLNKK
jgi:hypothetical protein